LEGSLVAGLGDLEFNLLSYATVLANNLATAVYLVGIKKLNKDFQVFSKIITDLVFEVCSPVPASRTLLLI
jgi:Na+-driven multidrug efflux pump